MALGGEHIWPYLGNTSDPGVGNTSGPNWGILVDLDILNMLILRELEVAPEELVLV
jgi:hypothetical protein